MCSTFFDDSNVACFFVSFSEKITCWVLLGGADTAFCPEDFHSVLRNNTRTGTSSNSRGMRQERGWRRTPSLVSRWELLLLLLLGDGRSLNSFFDQAIMQNSKFVINQAANSICSKQLCKISSIEN